MLFYNRATPASKQTQTWHLFISVVFAVLVGTGLANPHVLSKHKEHNSIAAHTTEEDHKQHLHQSFKATEREYNMMGGCKWPHLQPVNVGEWINVEFNDVVHVTPEIVAVKRCDLDCIYCEGKGKCQVKKGDDYQRRIKKTVKVNQPVGFIQVEVTEHLECECGYMGDGETVIQNMTLVRYPSYV